MSARLQAAPAAMVHAVTVRSATTADNEAMLRIWNEGRDNELLARARPGIHDWALDLDDMTRWIARHQVCRRPMWLALVDDEPAAMLSMLGFSDRPGGECTAEISIHVRQAMRGHGIGRRLVERAVATASDLGFDRYVAYIRRDNTPSIALFRGQGFSLWGCMPGVLRNAGRRFDFLLFGREM